MKNGPAPSFLALGSERVFPEGFLRKRTWPPRNILLEIKVAKGERYGFRCSFQGLPGAGREGGSALREKGAGLGNPRAGGGCGVKSR